jgi:hypothetical protein
MLFVVYDVNVGKKSCQNNKKEQKERKKLVQNA